MKKQELDNLLSKITPRLFELAYVLLPDDLQAQQAVIDSLTAFILQEKEWLNCEDADGLTKTEEANLIKDIYRLASKSLWSLCLKRSVQLPPMKAGEKNAFYALDTSMRGLLYLRYKQDIKLADLVEITQIKKEEIINKIYNAGSRLEHQILN